MKEAQTASKKAFTKLVGDMEAKQKDIESLFSKFQVGSACCLPIACQPTAPSLHTLAYPTYRCTYSKFSTYPPMSC